ncbi:hypothetical protein V8E53_013258 [Lactarius tabidus]
MYASVRFFAILVFAAAYTVIPSLSTPLVESDLGARGSSLAVRDQDCNCAAITNEQDCEADGTCKGVWFGPGQGSDPGCYFCGAF